MNSGQEKKVVIVGLPSSGKTTFLAALWHLITSRDVETVLRFESLSDGDQSYLNDISSRWARAEIQDRTHVNKLRTVSMNLLTPDNESIKLTFPDVSGESYRRMWEERDLDSEFFDVLESGNILLFIHSDEIIHPRWTVDNAELSRDLDVEIPSDEEVPWNAGLAPTEVKLVGLLQLLRLHPLDRGPRRLSIMLSAWDKGEAEGLGPDEFIERELPLLNQYLIHGSDNWEWRVYGVSAQGGDYDEPHSTAVSSVETEKLRALQIASERIKLIGAEINTHDLTLPIEWLIE